MIQGKRVLAIIPARGGSKGIPGKNIRDVAGKPLIAYTIEVALNSRYLDKIIVTSDNQEILSVAREYGAEILVRPEELAQDYTPGIEPVLHAIDVCNGYDYVVLLQPTSPLRSVQDVDAAIDRCATLKAPACVSVCAVQQSPYWMFTISAGIRLEPLMHGTRPTRRQDLPPAFVLNGAVYVAEIEWLEKTKDFITDKTIAYVMPNERSLDIDTERDIELASAAIISKLS